MRDQNERPTMVANIYLTQTGRILKSGEKFVLKKDFKTIAAYDDYLEMNDEQRQLFFSVVHTARIPSDTRCN